MVNIEPFFKNGKIEENLKSKMVAVEAHDTKNCTNKMITFMSMHVHLVQYDLLKS